MLSGCLNCIAAACAAAVEHVCTATALHWRCVMTRASQAVELASEGSYYGSADFNDQYMTKAFQQEPAAKNEMVEKTAMDAIPVQAIWSLTAGTNPQDWEQAAALYVGKVTASAPYERANKRAANFGTTEGNSDEAVANAQIVRALQQAPSDANSKTIAKNLKITYAQASLRYAYFLDQDLKNTNANTTTAITEHRAEGQAFYRIIAPFVKQADSSCDDFMKQMYDIDQGVSFSVADEGFFFCRARWCVPSALDISAGELGTLEDTVGHCVGWQPPQDCGLSDGQWAGIGIGIAVPSVTLICVGAYFLYTYMKGYRWQLPEKLYLSQGASDVCGDFKASAV
eukprot:364630-Chlamydomonas_euryale.AAC.3